MSIDQVALQFEVKLRKKKNKRQDLHLFNHR